MRFTLLLLLAACFPYLETYRPSFNGTVVDLQGARVAGVPVTACSYTRWSPPAPWNCPREASTVSDADGGFAFGRLREWEWCCLGEAPLPLTVVYACGDNDAGAEQEFASHHSPEEPIVLRVGSGSTRCP